MCEGVSVDLRIYVQKIRVHFFKHFLSGYHKTYYYYGKQYRKKICKKHCRNIRKTRKVCVKRCRPAKQKLCRYLFRKRICKSYLHCFLKPSCKSRSSVASTMKLVLLTHFSSVSHFYTPLKTFGFLTFSGFIEM